MTIGYAFRKPRVTTRLSPTFGIPRGTFGRGANSIEAIVLHLFQHALDTHAAFETNVAVRNAAQIPHSSLHYAIGLNGEVQQYVRDADIAWGMWDYDMENFPAAYPASGWSLLATHPGVSPDRYVIHIGAPFGEEGAVFDEMGVYAMGKTQRQNHARLIAWLCNEYAIPCDTTHVVTHDMIDTQFSTYCIGQPTYPYAQILADAQAIIAAGGETDLVFDPPPILEEYFGPFTVGYSRVSSAAYIRGD